MKETDFIKQNKKKWARFEKLSSNNNNDPDEVSELFTEITEDLSYARTFYPRRSVRVYLNQLSQGVFTSLYKQRKQPMGSFVKLWTEKIPLEMYRARVHLLTSFLFFIAAALIGIISQEYDPDFARVVLGDYYVDHTLDNISNNDPMGIYGESPETSMFFEITVNNIRVAFLAFAGGILFTLGTFWILMSNGIMLGAFQWWFKAKGLLFATFLAIWIHGAFEISAIVIAGAAGITVGNGLIFPKSYTRVQSLVFSAKRGLLIMLSLVPVFIMAGALESFVTRYYLSMPVALKLFIILSSFTLIIFYYVVFPFYVARRNPDKVKLEEVPRFIPKKEIKWLRIRKPGEIFTDTFTLFIAKFNLLGRLFTRFILPFILILLVVTFALEYRRFDYIVEWDNTFGTVFGTGIDFEYYKLFGWPLPLAIMISAAYFVIDDSIKDSEKKSGRFLKYLASHFIWLYIFAFGLFSILLFAPWFLLLLSVFVMPFLLMIPSLVILKKMNFFNALGESFNLGTNGYGDNLLVSFSQIAIVIIFFLIFHNPLDLGVLFLVDDLLKDTLITSVDHYNVVISAVNCVFYIFYFFVVLGIAFISFKLAYYSIEERNTATGLYGRLKNFGKRNRNYETEVDFE